MNYNLQIASQMLECEIDEIPHWVKTKIKKVSELYIKVSPNNHGQLSRQVIAMIIVNETEQDL